jgi:(2Fe-2S) ferredoxin
VLARLRTFAAAHPQLTAVRTSECLGPCEQADVVVVRPSPDGRRHGGRPVWFGLVDEYSAERLLEWVAAGGPGLAPIPDLLVLHRIDRPRPARQATAAGV